MILEYAIVAPNLNLFYFLDNGIHVPLMNDGWPTYFVTTWYDIFMNSSRARSDWNPSGEETADEW